MEFRLLGSVAVVTENGDVALGPAKRSSLLAMMLLRPNTPVNVGRLIDALWEDEPPAHAKTVLQGHVSRLRAVLAEHGAAAYGIELTTHGTAYTLQLPESLVDAHRFEELVALAGVQRRPADTVRMLREALSFWQGPALTGTVQSRPLEAAAGGLEERRLASVEALAHAYGQLGEHGRAAAVLRTEAVAHPLRETLAAALMLALGRSGRQSDAIGWYHRTRRLLAEELGVDPGEALGEAYATLLRSAEPTPAQRPAPQAPVAIPEQLPRQPRGFTGRDDELAALARAAVAGDAPVCLVTGPAGVGTTAFAVHWAYDRRADFPDGRLFADLRGFSDTPAPEAGSVLREFLLALGTPAQRMPETADAMGALFRSLTADSRLLVVLDNARSSEQVRPLLPGGDRCTTLVTSRDRLGGLIASDAARPVPLGLLPPADSVALLRSVLGAERVAAEPEAAARLAGLCDGLPLALRVTGARLAERPQWTLDAMVGELADEQGCLALLNIEDTGVSAALRLTMQQLPEPAARLFRAIGLHTGSDLDRFAAAALAGTSPAQASADLDRLAAAHLLTESVPGRWAPHDLVRLYARHLAPQADPQGLRRLLDHYLYTGLAADAAAEPGSQPCYALPRDFLRPPATREFEDRAAALAWYEAERPALEGAVAAAAALGLHDRAWRLALAQWPLMLWRIRDGWVPLLQAGLASAEHEGDLDAQARVRALLGWVLHEEGRDAEALVHLAQAPDLAARAGDGISEAIAYANLGVVVDSTGDHARAEALMTHAVSLAARTGHPPTQVLTLQHLARHCLATEAYGAALAHALSAAELVSPDAVVVRAQLQIVRAEALTALGRPEEAADQLKGAAATAEAVGFTEGSERAEELLARLSADR
ncbi:AfsR/SARP family transcriptional regulator [Streptomyces sp. H39-S7]|uniref:AfsR/SARP family transcriptional regulator n=1 Tax=Streptomyces sp. H39-S7 TaxID=3004357 RepID=UPI0022AED518|nr:AfsR/SARP family transcriptional regulator [Streptomyces sp. H39-S7]MCZ4120002.1 BTAD domain-containing putative transcriptional regulator [Streptomyces sp. H39-S7]